MDPFVLKETPDLYIVGNQPRFQTKIVAGEADEESNALGEKICRVVLVPAFSESGVLVLVNLRTLGVKIVRFAVKGMTGGGIMNGTKVEEG